MIANVGAVLALISTAAGVALGLATVTAQFKAAANRVDGASFLEALNSIAIVLRPQLYTAEGQRWRAVFMRLAKAWLGCCTLAILGVLLIRMGRY